MNPTDEQAAIITEFGTGFDLVIEAGAGTGKTSTLKMLARQAPRQRGVYIAYNRSIADDAQRSFPGTVTCKTAHGLAYAAVGRRFQHRLGGPRMPAMRSAQIMGIRDRVQIGTAILSPQQLARLVGETITRWCYSADDLVQLRHVPRVNGLDRAGQRELARYLAPIAQRAWDADLSRVDGQLRFIHDHYLKSWILSRPQLPCDFVLLDEAQDSNGAVAGLVTSQDAQKIWVGDRSQAIYGWRGATDAMEHAPGERLMLSQSFRFGQAIADEANKWLSILDAPLRLRGYDAIPSRVEPCALPDAILCRSNAGAINAVISAIGAGRRAALVGGGREIRRMAEAARDLQARRPTDHPELFAFSSWSEVRAYVEEAGAEASDLRVFVRLIDQHSPAGIIRIVDALADESDEPDVVVSTAHKAKGREWGSVRIASDFVEPKEREDGDPVTLHADECMLAYVAVTRAQLVLDRTGLAWVDRFVGLNPGGQDIPGLFADELESAAAPVPASVPEPVLEHAPEPLPLVVTYDPCEVCGYLPGVDGVCTTCPTGVVVPVVAAPEPAGPTAEAPFAPGDVVVYSSRRTSSTYLVDAIWWNTHVQNWLCSLRQPDGRVQQPVNPAYLELAQAKPALVPPSVPVVTHCLRCGSIRCICCPDAKRRWVGLTTAITTADVDRALGRPVGYTPVGRRRELVAA